MNESLSSSQVTHLPLDRICAYCGAYTFKPRPPGDTEKGTAYCREHEKWFPNQLDCNHKPAGMRTCPRWRQIGTTKEERA